MIQAQPAVSSKFTSLLVLFGAAALAAACDPNVLIGAQWQLQEGGLAGQGGSEALTGGAGGAGASAGAGAVAGTEAGVGGSAVAGEGGESGSGGAPPADPQWCAVAPWLNTPVAFSGETGTEIPAGSYTIHYMSGAQIHDSSLGYEVTDQYFGKNALQAGHHIYSGASPETGTTSLWLDDIGLVVSAGDVAAVEAAHRGHTWPLEHAGGELFITLYDDLFSDNAGPGTVLCITPTAP